MDFEHIPGIVNSSTREPDAQIGLAVLDTRDLKTSIPREKLVSTYNFITGSEKILPPGPTEVSIRQTYAYSCTRHPYYHQTVYTARSQYTSSRPRYQT